ncbi:MAG: hypothetical protein J7M12_03675, partial [Candidatus Hydrogenedentes bacterium]|nr:hypothetical protein [Candidatus Hydrogenedentota bacterium]
MKLVGTLFAVCVVCGSVLALVNSLTKDEIAKQERLREEKLRAEVLAAPGETITFDKPVTVAGRDYYVGRRADGSVAGTVFSAVTNEGYAGE